MRNTIKKIAPALLVLLALTTLSFMASDSVRLRLKPQQGKTYTITSKANLTTQMKVQGQTMSMFQVYETKQSFTPNKVSDNQCTIESQIDAIKMSISQMGMKLEYDSEHPEKTNPMLAEQTKEIEKTLKTPVTITYGALGQMLSEENELSSQMRDIIIQLPEEELSVGSKWNSTKTQNVNDIEINLNMEYTVTDISKKSVDVSYTGTVETTEISGTYEGTASIDPQTGLMMSSTTKTNISMNVEAEGMNIPMTTTGTTTVTVK